MYRLLLSCSAAFPAVVGNGCEHGNSGEVPSVLRWRKVIANATAWALHPEHDQCGEGHGQSDRRREACPATNAKKNYGQGRKACEKKAKSDAACSFHGPSFAHWLELVGMCPSGFANHRRLSGAMPAARYDSKVGEADSRSVAFFKAHGVKQRDDDPIEALLCGHFWVGGIDPAHYCSWQRQ